MVSVIYASSLVSALVTLVRVTTAIVTFTIDIVIVLTSMVPTVFYDNYSATSNNYVIISMFPVINSMGLLWHQ